MKQQVTMDKIVLDFRGKLYFPRPSNRKLCGIFNMTCAACNGRGKFKTSAIALRAFCVL